MSATPGLCPPTTQTSFDVRSAPSCAAMLQMLLQSYVNAMVGGRRVEVWLGDRKTYYQHTNLGDLLKLYQTLYAQCPQAALAGLPNLNPNLSVRRGPPGRSLNSWPRL
jgi:hypothetical protein